MESFAGTCVCAYLTLAIRAHRIGSPAGSGWWVHVVRCSIMEFRDRTEKTRCLKMAEGSCLNHVLSLFFFPMVFTRKGSFFVIFQSQYYFKMVKIKRYRFRSFQYRWCWEWTASLWELALFGRWCCGFQLQDSEQQITRVRREGTRRGKTAWVQIPTLHLVATYVGQVTSLLWRWTASSVKWGHCWTPLHKAVALWRQRMIVWIIRRNI